MRYATILKIALLTVLGLILLYIWFHKGYGGAQIGAKPTEAEVNGYSIEVVMEKAPLIILKPNPLKINIHRKDGQPITNADVDFELLMPNMFCGKVEGKAAASPLEPGIYRAEAIPLMTGTWTANINIKLDGNMTVFHVKHPFTAIR